MNKFKLVRITTVPISLKKLLSGQLEFMSKFYDVTAISSVDKSLKEYYNKHGIRFVGVNMKRKPSPLYDIFSLIKLIYKLYKLKPHIIHTHTPKAGLLGMMASRFLGVKIRLHTVAGIPWIEKKGLIRFIYKTIESITYKSATHVYSNSFALQKFILNENLLDKNKISVIYNGSSNGINTDWFKITKQIEDNKNSIINDFNLRNHKVIIFVGRLVKDKGIEELVTAFKELCEESFKIKLLLVGPFEHNLDPISNEILEIIKNHKNIICTDYIEDVRPYFLASDILTFPSYREGFPNVPLQAASMELPCIVSNINGCNEIIIDRYNGLVVEPRSYLSLKNAIKELILDQNLYNHLKSNCRKSILNKFDQTQFWHHLQYEYKRLLDEKYS